VSKLPVRPLTNGQRPNLASDLRALADEYDRADAAHIQQGIGVAMDDTFAAVASGAGQNGGGGGELTPVEAKASRRDPAAATALELVLRQQRVLRDVPLLVAGLKGWRRDRPTAQCAEGHTLPQGTTRCAFVDEDTGRRCGTRRETILRCGNIYHVNGDGEQVQLLPGQKRYRAQAADLPGAPEVLECLKCYRHRRRTGRSWGDATRFDLSGLVNDVGAFVSEEAWPDVHSEAR
jgi:hypothetical protein